MTRLQEFQDALGKWSDETFGADRGPEGPLNHLKEEIAEIIADPSDAFEFADAFMLLLDAARKAGFNTDDLLYYGEAKLKINKQRTWSPVDEDGVSRHIK